jgi:hypothetical protein
MVWGFVLSEWQAMSAIDTINERQIFCIRGMQK